MSTATGAPAGAAPRRPPAERLLAVLLRVAAASFVAFFGAGLVVLVSGAPVPDAARDLLLWGTNGRAYELMICAIYLVWGIFLWVAAREPARHRLFLDFTVVANVAHFATMLVEGLTLPGEHHHLYGDVLLGWVLLLPLAVTWSRVRRTTASRPPQP